MVQREHPASFHLQNELPEDETQGCCRCNLIFPQTFLVHWYRKLELLSTDSLFLCVGMAAKVLVFWILDLFVKKHKRVERKRRKGKTVALNFSDTFVLTRDNASPPYSHHSWSACSTLSYSRLLLSAGYIRTSCLHSCIKYHSRISDCCNISTHYPVPMLPSESSSTVSSTPKKVFY